MQDNLSPFEPRPGFGGVVVRVADKRWYLRHWHSHAATEMNLVVRGTGTILLETRRYPLLPGHIVWLWPGERHIPSNWSDDLIVWIIEWQPDFMPRLIRPRSPDPAPFFCRRVESGALHRLDGFLASLAAVTGREAFRAGLQFAFLALWEEFMRAAPVKETQGWHPRIEKVIGMLSDPLAPQSLRELAAAAGLSPYHLSVLFRRQTGMSLPAYRNQLRLNRFFALYREHPELALLTLALDAGFGSYAQFYRVFRSFMGRTPGRWTHAIRP
jgi:AraC-like DNA-binding protein